MPRHHFTKYFYCWLPRRNQKDFDMLLDFIREARLDRVGAFAYSPVEGARANELANHVPEEIQQERRERFMQMQAEISADKLKEKIGKTITVLIDAVEDDVVVARSAADAPEIDGLVYIEQAEGLTVGDFVEVRVTRSDEYDLWAQLID